MMTIKDCRYHKMTNDGTWDVCIKHKFKTEFDCYDAFISTCKNCKDREPYKGKFIDEVEG